MDLHQNKDAKFPDDALLLIDNSKLPKRKFICNQDHPIITLDASPQNDNTGIQITNYST